MSVMLFKGATVVKKNSCLVTRTVSFVTAGVYLLTFRILDSYSSKDIELDLSHVNDVIIGDMVKHELWVTSCELQVTS